MICDAILMFVLVFNDGHKEQRTKYLSHEIANIFWNDLQDSEFIKRIDPPECCSRVEELHTLYVAPYDCDSPPKI